MPPNLLNSPEERDTLLLRKLQASLASVNKQLLENPEEKIYIFNKKSLERDIDNIKSRYFYVVKEAPQSDA